jgi:hypothetical protein
MCQLQTGAHMNISLPTVCATTAPDCGVCSPKDSSSGRYEKRALTAKKAAEKPPP